MCVCLVCVLKLERESLEGEDLEEKEIEAIGVWETTLISDINFKRYPNRYSPYKSSLLGEFRVFL